MPGTSDFRLHERLEADTFFVTDWPLSRVLLMNDTRYTWLVLVPRRNAVSEIHELPPSEQAELMAEMARAGRVLKSLTAAKKINIGALGNLVPQLHVHVVARLVDDPAWPAPVWGHSPPSAFDPSEAQVRVAELRDNLQFFNQNR